MTKYLRRLKNCLSPNSYRLPKELKKYVVSHDELMKRTENLDLSGTVIKLRSNGNDKKT